MSDLPDLEVHVHQVDDGGGGIELTCPMCLGRSFRGQLSACWVSCEWCGGDGTIDDPDDLRWIDTLEEYLTVLFKGLV